MTRFGTRLAAVLLIGSASLTWAEEPKTSRSGYGPRPAKLDSPIPLEKLPQSVRDVMAKPTLTALGPIEEFCATPIMYQWLLDHPDRASLAWQRLNIAAIDIQPLDNDRFRWRDEHGSEVAWKTIAKNDDGRVWLAEGKVRVGALVPMVPVKAVAVLRHTASLDDQKKPQIKHQTELFLQTDSKAAALVVKMYGSGGPKMAEQGAEQLQMFFSGIGRYAERFPEKVPTLLSPAETQRR